MFLFDRGVDHLCRYRHLGVAASDACIITSTAGKYNDYLVMAVRKSDATVQLLLTSQETFTYAMRIEARFEFFFQLLTLGLSSFKILFYFGAIL